MNSQPLPRSVPQAASAGVAAAAPESVRAAPGGPAQEAGPGRGKTALVDAAYDEYCRLRLAGEAVDPDAFCARYPRCHSSLRRVLRTHRWFENQNYVLTKRQSEDGTVLGFTLLRELGRGSFARVYLAAEPSLGGRQVVVKFSQEGGDEAQTLGRLDHPNIVPVHSVREDRTTGLTAVCMPYLGSATLEDVIDSVYANRGGCRWAASILRAVRDAAEDDVPAAGAPAAILRRGTYADGVLHLAVQLADALAYVHARGICHGDLKPSNVLLRPDGRPMLLDFNLSVAHQSADPSVGGTLPYMAPEQLAAFRPPPDRPAPGIDARADVFSLGAMLYELMSGCQPFGHLSLKLTAEEQCEQMRQRHPRGCRPLREANPRVEKGLARLVESCLAFDPAGRPQSAAELAAALRKHLAPRCRARRWASARRTLVAGTLALGVLAGVAARSSFVPAEPFGDYHLRLGEAALREGKAAEAIPHFDDVINAQPDLARAYFLRGRAFQRLDDFESALRNFDHADELAPDGPVKACRAYCKNRLQDDHAAVWLGLEAVELGFTPPAVLNNLGYSYLRIEKPVEAQRYLEQALQQDPSLRAAHFNLAMVDGYRAGRGQGKHFSADGIKHIETALRLGPARADLHAYAAYLYAVSPPDAAKAQAALDHLEKALALGWEPQQFRFLNDFEALAKEPRFQAILKRPAARKPAVSTPKLLDPVQDAQAR